MSELPRGTVTLLFTDVQGSTQLLQKLGRDAYLAALNEHRRLLREAFSGHGGVLVDMQGDSFFFAFAQARSAVQAAAAAQEALAEHVWETEPILVRIGIHTGEPIVDDNLYAGLDVHRAARVMSAAHGGQILVSETTQGLLQEEPLDGLSLHDLGMHRLKDLARPVRLYQVGAERFPALKTLDATNLPIAAYPLLGREHEIEELVAHLRDGTRLLTITGTGGTGKTRLALQVAAELVGSFADGVVWVPLAGISDPELVVPTISQALQARAPLGDHLRGKQLLLLLDNVEHLRQAAPHLAELLNASAQLRFLVTSRAPLHLAAEVEYPLDPLPTGVAVALFVERARAAGSRIVPDAAVEAICARLDGLPLAIELAAARTRVLTPEVLRTRLERSLPLLVGGARDAPERQQTLRATIEWSHDLLDEESRRLFARASIFEGSFSLEAAEAICDAELDIVAALVDISLLKPIGDGRFLMLETVREYAREQLEGSTEADELRRRHAQHFLRLTADAEPRLRGRDQKIWLDRLESDIDQIRSGLAFLWETADDEAVRRLTADLAHFWFVRGYFSEGRLWLERALDRTPAAHPLRPSLLADAGFLSVLQGAIDAARTFAQEGLSSARRREDRDSEAQCLQVLSIVAHMDGRNDEAHRLQTEGLGIRRTLGDSRAVAVAAGNLATMAIELGNRQEARALLEESAAIFEDLDEDEGLSFSLASLGLLDVLDGRLEAAQPRLLTALAHAAAAQHQLGIMYCFDGLAAVWCPEEPERAAALLGATNALSQRLGALRAGQDVESLDAVASAARTRLGDRRFETAWSSGAAMSLSEALELALGRRA